MPSKLASKPQQAKPKLKDGSSAVQQRTETVSPPKKHQTEKNDKEIAGNCETSTCPADVSAQSPPISETAPADSSDCLKEGNAVIISTEDEGNETESTKRDVAKDKTTILRDDEECFLADFTKAGIGDSNKQIKFELWDPFKRGRIAASLVELDPDVTLRIRDAPGLDAQEVGEIKVGETFDIAGCCGCWLRIYGNEERWVMEKNEDLVLVEVLPQSAWGLSWGTARSLLSSWSTQGVKKGEEDEGQNSSVSTGWGMGLFSKKVTEYMPASISAISSSALEISSGVASNAVSKILAVGTEPSEGVSDSEHPNDESDISLRVKNETPEERKLDTGDVQGEIKGVDIDQGGLAPVRIVSQGITYIEGTIGWLGEVAGGVKAAALDSSALLSDDIVDKAWEGVKGTAKASKTVVVGSTDAICHVTELGRAALVNVAEAVLPVTSDSAKDQYPNRTLGGILAIELCGAIVQRDPLAEEDDDQFVSDDFTSTPPVTASFAAISRLVEERFQMQVNQSYLDGVFRWSNLCSAGVRGDGGGAGDTGQAPEMDGCARRLHPVPHTPW